MRFYSQRYSMVESREVKLSFFLLVLFNFFFFFQIVLYLFETLGVLCTDEEFCGVIEHEYLQQRHLTSTFFLAQIHFMKVC